MKKQTNINKQVFPNQTRGMNFYLADKNLHNFLRRSAPELLKRESSTFERLGSFVGGRLDKQAQVSDQTFPPALYDVLDDPTKPQSRKNELRLNPEYEDCQQELYRMGLISKCFDQKDSASHLLPFVGQYLVSQSDISTGCPFAMTHPVAFILDTIAPQAIKSQFMPEILRNDGQTAICGTWSTERHSGSDVGGTVTTAKMSKNGQIHLKGHNWFTSAFGFKKFITIKTARPDSAKQGSKGLGLYLVPSHIDNNWSTPNSYEITHLKRKLGTKGLPTVEVELENTLAYELAPEGQGLNAMMTALGCSRVHNSMAAAGVMHRAYLETMCWLDNRKTFGDKLATRPMMQKRALDITTQWMAGSALAFEAARSFDNAAHGPGKEAWMRVATALAKFKTGEQAVWCAEKALEAIGGNGYTEDYPTARLYRDAMVLRVWEGPEQIQALELMRMVAGKEPGDALFLARLREVASSLPVSMTSQKTKLMHLSHKARQSLEDLRQAPKLSELAADEYLHFMSDVLAYALLCEEAQWDIQHDNDKAKLLFADHFYGLTFEKSFVPQLKKSVLHTHFDEAVRGKKIPATVKTVKPHKGSAPNIKGPD